MADSQSARGDRAGGTRLSLVAVSVEAVIVWLEEINPRTFLDQRLANFATLALGSL